MNINISHDPKEMGRAAGAMAGEIIRGAIAEKGMANIILATGTSQFETLNQLIKEQEIDWRRVTMFHLDEYIGLPVTHPASFRKYLKERFLSRVPNLKVAYLINGDGDAVTECEFLGNVITQHRIDLALAGIGENGHLAFNDPPADFETVQPYIVVSLDEPCRMQQLGEGWFNSIEDVPKQAISMSIRQIMKSQHIICSVPDKRKAVAVKSTLMHAVSNLYPASILQLHESCTLFLDQDAASLLEAGKASKLSD